MGCSDIKGISSNQASSSWLILSVWYPNAECRLTHIPSMHWEEEVWAHSRTQCVLGRGGVSSHTYSVCTGKRRCEFTHVPKKWELQSFLAEQITDSPTSPKFTVPLTKRLPLFWQNSCRRAHTSAGLSERCLAPCSAMCYRGRVAGDEATPIVPPSLSVACVVHHPHPTYRLLSPLLWPLFHF